MKAIIFRRQQKNDITGKVYPANSFLIAPDQLTEQLKAKYDSQGKKDVFKIDNINAFFPDFNAKKHKRNPILFLRTGGIGDLMAFSTLFEQLKEHKTIFATLSIYKPCFEWYTTKPGTIREVTLPVFENVTFSRLRSHFGNIRYANYEGQVENFQKDNWYKVFFNGIGLDYDEKLARPSLIKSRIVPENNNKNVKSRKSLFLVHRASANMRTISIEDALISIKKSKFNDWTIYLHEFTLSETDKKHVTNSELNIKIIPKGSMHQALLDWFDAEFILSSDTGSIHFREGIEKPALAAYAAFHPRSRTETYKHVSSAYFESLCPAQPCYLHETETIKFCKYGQGLEYAPCLSKKLYPDFNDHLTQALNENFSLFSFK